MFAFIGSSELMLAALVGLLLFGGRLPEVLREVGKVWFRLRRSINDLKRESGLDEAIRDIRRETEAISFRPEDLQRELDPFAGPAKEEEPAKAKADRPIAADEKPHSAEEGESPSKPETTVD